MFLLVVSLVNFTAFSAIGQNSLVLTYNLGDIESDRDFTILGDFSECPGVLTVDIPAGFLVTGMDVSYDITAQGGAWMSEQRSWLYSPDLGAGEPEVYSGVGSTPGTFSYSRTDISFANFATGTFDVELHVGRTWPFTPTDCNTTYQFVVNGTWELTVYYEEIPPCTPPSSLSVDEVGVDFVDLSWEESILGNEDEYEWELRTEGDPGSGPDGLVQSGTLPASTLSATLSGLEGLTSYTFYIRSDCDGDESIWVSAVFNTVPANNLCTTAELLLPQQECDGNFIFGSTQGATNSGEGATTCAAAGLAGGDIWYSFVATTEAVQFIYNNVVGNPVTSSNQTSLYSGTCGNLEQIRCVSSNLGGVFSGLNVGETYYISIHTFSSDPNHFNTFEMCLLEIPEVTNDDCDDAIELFPSADLNCTNTITANTNGTNSMAVTPACNEGGLDGGDVWFKFTATSESHRIRYSNVLNNGTFGTLVTEVYSGDCGNLVSIDCGTSNVNRDLFDLNVGTTYYVRVWTTSTVETQFNVFDICIGTIPTLEDGDDCADAIVLEVSTGACENQLTVSTIGATNSMAIDPSCSAGGLAGGDIWFEIEATAESMAVIYSNVTTIGGFGTLVTELYTGTCAGLVSLGCIQSNNPLIAEGLTIGDTYYLRVWTSSTVANQGNIFDICVLEIEEDSDCNNPFVIDPNELPYSFLNGNTLLYGNNFASADRPSIDNIQFGDGTGGGVYLNGFDAVFEFTPDRDMLVNIELTEVGTWVGLWLFEDCPFTETVAFQTISAAGGRLLPEIQLTEGVDYYIVISTWPAPANTPFNLFVEELFCEIECPDNVDVSTDAGECGADLAIDFPILGEYCPILDFDDFLENSFNDDPNASGFYSVGFTEVTYTYTDADGGEFTCSFSVTVTDEEAPEITCPANVTVEVDFGVTEAFVGDLVATAEDNCGVESIVNSYNDGGSDASDIYPEGTTIVTFTATDESGNTSECNTSVIVTSDDVPPIEVVCQNVTVELDSDGNATVDAEDLDGGSTGGAGSLTFTVDGEGSVSFDCDDVGANTVTLTATDDLGFSESCDATVTVEDNIAPTLNCEAEVVQMVANPGDTEVFVNVPMASAADNCGIASLENSFNDGGADASDVYSVGTTTVTFTAIDDNGNSAQCVTSVTVEADLSIVAICDNASVDLDTDGNASVNAADLDGGSFGGDGALSFSVGGFSTVDFDCEDVGDNSVTLTVSDAAGNSESCEATVTVSDNMAPSVSCASLVNKTVDNVGDLDVFVDIPLATATDNCGVESIVNSYNDGGADASDVYPVGTTQVVFTATDVNGNSATCQTTVIVVADDSIIPVCADVSADLDADGNATVAADDLDGGSFGGDGDLSFSINGESSISFDCGDVGANTVVLTVTDEEGNSETCESVVTISDNIAPEVSCAAAVEQMVANPGDTEVFVDLPLASATDNCGVASIDNSVNNGGADASDVYSVGTHVITYTATDVNGNSAQCETVLTVLADESLVAICTNGAATIDASGTASISAAMLDGGSFGGEGALSFTVGGSATVEFGCDDLGTNTVTLEVTDAAGTTESCEATVVVDLDGVTEVSCNDDIVVELDADGNASVDMDDLIASAEATCGIMSTTASQLDFDCSNLGSNGVVITITNIEGDEASCTATVMVVDNNDPVAECLDLTFPIPDADQTFFVNPLSLDGGSSATCGDLEFSIEGGNPGFTCDDEGVYTVTLVVTSDAGSTATCEAQVTVLCVEGLIQISGNVEREFGQAVGGVEMAWLGTPGGISLSQGTGLYQIFVEENSNAVVTPQKDGNPSQFVTTADLIALQRHILGIELFESPYQIIAGDASGDDVVSTFDLVVLQSLIIGIIEDFASPVWRFVPESYVFSDPSNPFGEDFPEVKGYQGVVNPQMDENWVAIKTGDVAWNHGGRLAGALNFNVIAETAESGNQYLVFKTAEATEIFGYQMALDFDNNLSVAEFIPGASMIGMNDLNFNIVDGIARTNYYNGEGIQLETGTEVFRLRIHASEVANALSLVDIYNQDDMRAEGYPVNGEMVQITLGTLTETSESWSINNISPVPASDYLSLELNVTVDTDFDLEVYNSNGQLIQKTSYNAFSGINVIPFDLSDYAAGAYFIRIVSSDKTDTLPFIKVD